MANTPPRADMESKDSYREFSNMMLVGTWKMARQRKPVCMGREKAV